MRKYIWGYHWLRAARMKKQETAIKLRTQSDILRAECLLQASVEARKGYARLYQLILRCSEKAADDLRARFKQDEKGTRVLKDTPVFTEEQIGVLKKYPLSLLVITILVVSEAAMFWLVAPLFLPGASDWLKLAVAASLALLSMSAFHWGLTWHFKHMEVCDKGSDLPASTVRKYNHRRLIGYGLIAVTMTAVIYSGLMRSHFLEGAQYQGLSSERVASLKLAGKCTAWFTMLVTIAAAVLTALMKQEAAESGVSHHVYRAWRKTRSRSASIYRKLLAEATRVESTCAELTHKYWQLVLRLYELYHADDVVDKRYEEADREFTILKATDGFVMTDSLYQRFSVIQSGHEVIFKHGILSEPSIKAKLELVKEAKEAAKRYMAEQRQVVESRPPSVLNIVTNLKSHFRNGIAKMAPPVLIAGAILMGACTKPAKPVNAIALADFTTSSDSSDVAWYGQVISHEAIENLGPKDRIVVLPIDAASQTDSREIFAADFSRNTYANEYAGLSGTKVEAEAHHDSASEAAGAFAAAYRRAIPLRRVYNGQSDIIGALRQAVKYRKQDCKNDLIILSDMHQSLCSGLDFDKMTITDSMASGLAGRMGSVDLTGFTIVVLTGNQSRVTPQRYLAIKKVWETYFARSGGKLLDYSSSATASLRDMLGNQSSNQ